MKKKLSPYLPGILLFTVCLLISLFTFKDYGVAWDEQAQEQIGTICYNYIQGTDSTFKTYFNKEYGVAFELPLIALEKNLKLTDSRKITLVRHFSTHFFFLFAALCGYVLFYRLFRSRFIACTGFLMLVCNPRLYAHSFFNTKDIPLLCAVLICFTIAQIAFDKNKTLWYLLLGIACAYATAIRLTAIILPLAFTCFFIIDIVTGIVKKKKPLFTFLNFVLFALTFCGVLYVSWPALWGHPFHNFAAAYETFSHFKKWDYGVLFMGDMPIASMLPWYYIPVWFLISTPELWILAALAGTIWILLSFAKKPLDYISNTPARNFLLYGACFYMPVIAVLKLHSIVYDDWRHLYFIYPAFILLALFAINKLMQTRSRRIVQLLCVAQLTVVSIFMFRNHPFQQLYFNNLVSHKEEHLRKNFEMDYWGCSFKQGLDYILAHDTRPKIKIASPFHSVVENNIGLLPLNDRERFMIVDDKDLPDYFITNFRGHPGDYDYPGILFNIKVLNNSVLRVYKCH